MVERYIKLISAEQVKKLVRLVNSYEINVFLSENNNTVNAKSTLRVLTIDFSKPIRLMAECDPDSDFIKELDVLLKE